MSLWEILQILAFVLFVVYLVHKTYQLPGQKKGKKLSKRNMRVIKGGKKKSYDSDSYVDSCWDEMNRR